MLHHVIKSIRFLLPQAKYSVMIRESIREKLISQAQPDTF
jgi:hypothetical protein